MTKQWKLKEIVLLSILGVVFAVIYLLAFGLGQGLVSALTPFGIGPLGYEFIYGIWFIVSIIAAYIIRKPGAAFISELIAGVVQVLIGSPAGPQLIISAAIQGLGAESAFAVTKWRDYRTRVLLLAAVLTAIVSFAWHYYSSGFFAYEAWLVGVMLITRIISSMLIMALLGKWISDQLAKTGVLRGYALGKERQQNREQDAA